MWRANLATLYQGEVGAFPSLNAVCACWIQFLLCKQNIVYHLASQGRVSFVEPWYEEASDSNQTGELMDDVSRFGLAVRR